MIKHVIIWTLSDELSDEQRLAVKADAKVALEGLLGNIDGLLDIKLNTEMLPSSSGEMMLDSSFRDISAIEAYQAHPMHQDAANKYIRPYAKTRLCCDYEL